MSDQVINPKSSVKAIVLELQNDLLTYQKTSNPLQFIVKRKQAIINKLRAIDAEIDFLANNGLWSQLQKEIDRITAKDEEIERISINIDLKPYTNKQSLLNVKHYVGS